MRGLTKRLCRPGYDLQKEQAIQEAIIEIRELRAKIEAMEQQEPIAWLHETRRDSDVVTDAVKHVWGKAVVGSLAAYSIPLYLAPGAQPAQKAVAYLDLGAGEYMDIGTDLNDEQLASLPKGRHMLGIVGTYGVDGYVSAQPALNLPVDLITDYLVSISAHVAHQDDPKAQAEILELLRMLAAAQEAKP